MLAPDLASANQVISGFEHEIQLAIAKFSKGRFIEAASECRMLLARMRNEATAVRQDPIVWKQCCEVLSSTKLFELAHLDPFTSHGYQKPRGYPGDALLLDWIYRDFRLLETPLAGSPSANLYRQLIQSPATTAVRWRREQLASHIDDQQARKKHARVLAVAAGHLREAELSAALKNRGIEELVALDQDAQSLAEVESSYVSQGMPITTLEASIRDVIVGRCKVSNFDLIYSAGLYDYLEKPVAMRLTSSLWKALNPGGSLLVTNFLEGTIDRAWAEAMMDWWLIYRSPEEIVQLAGEILANEIASQHYFACPTGCIGYLLITKADVAA
jgi:extracellular factor (EF) 3-hydroxypalmitic acid methyl ester biosynthesis protein